MSEFNTGFILIDEMKEEALDQSYYMSEAEAIDREYRNG